MQVNQELIESLLWEPEGTALDFKIQLPTLAEATEHQKGELLKDILAMANAFRREDAFILVGVKEVKGGRSEVVGINHQFEDAHLQQLVSSKVQRPLSFSYRATTHDGKPIGVFHIPKQKRPFYSRIDFGKIKKGAVYVRRGSTTEIAQPDEISAMGADQFLAQTAEPRLDFSFVDSESSQMLGNTIELKCLALRAPEKDDIPDYSESDSSLYLHGFVNDDYYRELVDFMRAIHLLRKLSFAITNSGDVLASDVRLVVEIDDLAKTLRLCRDDQMPQPPQPRMGGPFGYPGYLNDTVTPDDLDVKRTNAGWRIECRFGKIQPKDTVYFGWNIYIGSYESQNTALNMKIFADNLSQPVAMQSQITFAVEDRNVELEDIEKMEFERFRNTPEGQELLKGEAKSSEVDGND